MNFSILRNATAIAAIASWTLLKTSRFWEENDSIGGGVILGEASCRNQVFGILKIGFVG